MKIIKTWNGKIYFIFGAYYKDPIKDYIEIKHLFRNRRIYSLEISDEFEIVLKRTLTVCAFLVLLITIIGLLS